MTLVLSKEPMKQMKQITPAKPARHIPPNGKTCSADAPGLPTSQLTGAASAPAAPELSVIDAQRSRGVEELAHMIESLKILSDEIKAKWIEIAARRTTTVDQLETATVSLIRISDDLHGSLVKAQCQLTYSRRTNRRAGR